MSNDEEIVTCSVPGFGVAILDLCPNSSYGAAARDEIPTMKFGNIKRVPVRLALRPILGDNEAAITAAINRIREVEERLRAKSRKRSKSKAAKAA